MKEIKFSKKAINCNESGTIKLTPVINKLRNEGKNIISFAVGEPDLDTPNEIKNETINAINNNKTRYSSVSGITELKNKIAEKENVNNNNIIITNGSKQGLFELFQILLDKDDEIIIPRPYWVSYEEQIKLANGNCIFSDTINHQLNINDIKSKITNKTKAIIINSCNNPTGAVYNLDDLNIIKKLSDEFGFFIIMDDAYEDLIYEGQKHNLKLDKNTILVKTFSKSFSMTGFRIGYIIANQEIIKTMNKLQSHITGNVNTFSQYGAIKCFDIYEQETKKRKELYQKRRDLAYNLCCEIFDCVKPQGAFYLFPDVSNKLNDKNGKTSFELTQNLLNKALVAVIPGEVFGVNNHLRISFACSDEDIIEGFRRIKEILG
jgi:aspartate aminotransferase